MEAVVVVGEALLSASVQPLIQRLTSHEFNIFVRREKIDADIKDWKMILAEINVLLNDAEDKQMTDPVVKMWLDEFRDLNYDIEDVLDEFNTQVLKRKVMKASTNKLPKLTFTSSVFKNKMASRIKHNTERLERIKARQEQTLNLRRIANGTRSNQLKERPPTSSLVDDSSIYGRNDEKEAIVQKLLRDEGSNNPISVIPILGMGGIGKTTLAQLVYNDSAVKDHFDIKVWVCVSENFDVVGLTRTILRKVDSQTPDLNDLDLDSLQETLKVKLCQKKFLLILDDVWEEDYNLWDLLQRPFVSTATSSKIVVTSRKSNVAPIRNDVHAYGVKELSNDDCLCLLARHALAAPNFDARLDLKDIGQKLVKRCNGLPLAAKVLGGLLRNKGSYEEWEHVLRNKWWNSTESSNNVHPTLKLSYNDLPSHLKRCFVYCAIFPKDYEFGRDELVRLWMAEGFLQHRQGGMLMEDMGIEYFEDLVSRSFFQWSSSNQSRSLFGSTTSIRSAKFVMHDLISDLAQTIAGDICYNYENKTNVDTYEKVRHASFSFHGDSQGYEVHSLMKKLRTIWRRGDLGVHGNKILEESLTLSKKARVLSLPDSRTKQRRHYPSASFKTSFSPRTKQLESKVLSESIGDLIHLRHINLSGTSIQQLPESASNLFNLQTLLLHYCFKLEKLPDKIRNLVNLHHLDISETHQLKKLPSGIGMLTNLQTLSKFIVQKGHGTTIAELKNLSNLRGSLSIEGLENVEDAKLADLKGKQGLEELELKWDDDGRDDVSVIESLEPHQNLKRLTISLYGGAEFPSWMTNIHLVSLTLMNCKETKVLPPLGQLRSLKELIIDGLNAVKRVGVEFYGTAAVPFPSLERLKISFMLEWIEWSHGNMVGDRGFPNLQRLRIDYCPKLIESLPSGLQHLSELEIIDCEKLVSFSRMCLSRCLKRIYVGHCDALECFPIIDTGDGRESLLEELEIEYCSSLEYFQRNFKLPNSLRKLEISSCGNLLSLPDGLPFSLKCIHVSYCDALKYFPIIYTDDSEQSLLEELEIEDCSSLEYFQRNFKLPNSLRKLGIRNCGNLLSLPDGLMVQDDNANQSQSQCHLEHLEIRECQRLTTTGKFPAALKILEISECSLQLESPFSENNKALETIVISNNNIKELPSIDCLPSLKELSISGCPALESFPEMGFRSTSLQNLRIEGCENLSLLPIRSQSHFPSLQTLSIRDCPNMLSFVEDGGLPRNLIRLVIWECEKLWQPIADWGLSMLSSLNILYVSGRCPAFAEVTLFPDEDCCWLPTSLKELRLTDFVSLESVSMGLQMLTSLERLCFEDCPKLRSRPEDALPSSLKFVDIYGCPLLKKNYFSERNGLKVSYYPFNLGFAHPISWGSHIQSLRSPGH